MMINNKKVLVIGDVILDVWTYAKALGLSLETPTLKAKLTEKKHTFGGTGNVVSNLKELGADVTFLTLLGEDEYTKIYDDLNGIKLHSIIEDNRKNTIKERFWVERGGSNYKHLQVNVIDNKSIKKDSIDKMINMIENLLSEDFDVIMLIDYRHGLFTKKFLNELMPVLTKTKIPIIVSSQISDYGRGLTSNHINFKGADLIVMNKLEAEFNLGDNQSMSDLVKIFDCDVCVTSGRGGSTLFTGDEEYHSEVIDIEEIDPCGAGDSFISALSLTDWRESPKNSLFISNCWAGLSVQNHGTVCPSLDDLKSYLEREFYEV
tara:strand:- start:18 stop:974 length:957 start_codon:yes stop_codon:yes gene_type:complete